MMYSLEQIADLLDSAHRMRADANLAADGKKYIKLSDAVARQLSASIRAHIRGEQPGTTPLKYRLNGHS